MGALKKAFGDYYDQMEFVEADLDNSQSLFEAIKGCSYVIHVANPVPDGVQKMKDEDFIIPAANGMRAVLDAAVKNRVKKLVVTSSMSAVSGDGWKTRDSGLDGVYTEEDFAPMAGSSAYDKSKIEQERIKLDFLKLQEIIAGDYKLQVVSLCPGFIMGPSLLNISSSSISAVCSIMRKEMPGVAKIMFPVVDVRDVAQAHVEAYRREDVKSERILLT